MLISSGKFWVWSYILVFLKLPGGHLLLTYGPHFSKTKQNLIRMPLQNIPFHPEPLRCSSSTRSTAWHPTVTCSFDGDGRAKQFIPNLNFPCTTEQGERESGRCGSGIILKSLWMWVGCVSMSSRQWRLVFISHILASLVCFLSLQMLSWEICSSRGMH